jgi:hypothetical protein
VQRSSIELSEQRDAAVKALQADVAQLQEAHDKAADDARPALAEQLAAKQAELAAGAQAWPAVRVLSCLPLGYIIHVFHSRE